MRIVPKCARRLRARLGQGGAFQPDPAGRNGVRGSAAATGMEKWWGVVRAAQSLGELHSTLRTIYLRLFVLALLTAGLSAIVSLLLARHFTQPLEFMREGLKRFAAGQLEHKMPLPETVELADVARGMNEMAGQLRERIRTVEQQRNEQEAVLTSMREGVLALDCGGQNPFSERIGASPVAHRPDIGSRAFVAGGGA